MARARTGTAKRDPDAASRRKAALFEVSLGRRCALAATLAWLTLAMLATLFMWQDRVIQDPVGFFALFSFLLPLGPAVAGLGVSVAALITKRGHLLGGHLKADHNIATLAGLILSGLVLAVAVGIQAGSVGQRVGLYTAPLGMMGICLGLMGFLLTWGGWSVRKVTAILCSLVPAVVSAGHIAFPATSTLVALAAWEYMVSGGLFLTSGVIFVVSMTATAAAEREIVRGADERVAAEYARLRSLKKELDGSLSRTASRAAQLDADAQEVESRRHEADDYALQAKHLKDEAASLFDRASKAEADAQAQAAKGEGAAAALAARENELKALVERRAAEERDAVELRRVAIQQKAEAEALRRKLDAERQAVAEQLSHAKRERESARATMHAAEQRAQESLSKEQQSADLRSQLEAQRAVLTAQTSQVGAERVRALEEVQTKLSAQRASLEGERAAHAAERAKVGREAEGLAEREAALATRAAEVDTVEKGLGDAFAKLAKEKAEAEGLKRQADMALGEAADRSKSYKDSFTKVAEREASTNSRVQAMKAEETRLSERVKRVEEQDKLLADRARALALERRSLAEERERFGAEAQRLKQREEAIFHFEKNPEFAREAAKALESELAFGRAESPQGAAPSAAAPGKARAPSAPPQPTGAASGRFSLGNLRLDELVGGGLPVGSSLLVVGPAFCGKEAIPLGFIAAGLALGEPAILVTTVKSPAEIIEELAFMTSAATKGKMKSLMRFVDCSGKGGGGDVPRDHLVDVASPADFTKIREAIGGHFKALEKEGHAAFRFAYLPLTESWRLGEPNVARSFVQQMVAAVRRQAGGAIWVAESGIHSADEIESLAGMMQGVVRCQEERDGHALRVQGVPGTKPHQWVRYRHSPKGIDLGAFELERIR